MVSRLMSQHIEVSRAKRTLSTEGRVRFPAGTYVVRLDQPYRNYAVDLLTPQNYPKDATRTLRRFVVGIAGALPSARRSLRPTPPVAIGRLELLTEVAASQRENRRKRRSNVFILDDSGQEGLLEARYRLLNLTWRSRNMRFTAGGIAYHAGTWIIPHQAGSLRSAAR